MKDLFPFPEKSEAKLALIVVILLGYLLYYFIGFSILLKIFRGQFNSVLVTSDAGSLCPEVYVTAQVPKWLFQNGSQWVYVNVNNKSSQSMDIDLLISFPTSKDFQNVFALPSFYKDNVVENKLAFGTVDAGSSKDGRILLVTSDQNIYLDEIVFSLYCGQYSDSRISSVAGSVEISPGGALVHSILENILLPPWANGVIPFIALFSVYFVEKIISR